MMIPEAVRYNPESIAALQSLQEIQYIHLKIYMFVAFLITFCYMIDCHIQLLYFLIISKIVECM